MNKCQWTRYILSRQLFVYPTATWHLSVRFRLTDTLHCHSTEFCSNLCIRHFQLPCSIQYTRRFAPNSYKLRYHFWYFLSTIQPNSYQLSVFFMPPAYIRHSSSSVDDIYPLSNIIHKKTQCFPKCRRKILSKYRKNWKKLLTHLATRRIIFAICLWCCTG